MSLHSAFNAWRFAVPLFCLASCCGLTHAQEAIEARVRAIFEKTRAAVVRVDGQDEQGRLSGTGFFVDPSGTLVTAYSVGGDAKELVVHFGDKKYPAHRLVGDVRTGIAILKIDAPTPFLTPRSGEAPGVATPVISVGYTVENEVAPLIGVIAGRDGVYRGRYLAGRLIRSNLPVQRGFAGAPLLDLSGEVIGVVASSIEGGSGCHSIPVAIAEKLRSDFVRFGESRPGWLGLTIDAGIEEGGAGNRTLISGVCPNSPAAVAGVLAGDLLLSVGGRAVHAPEDVLDATLYLTAGDPVELRVLRAGEEKTLGITPAEVPGRAHTKRIGVAGAERLELAVPR